MCETKTLDDRQLRGRRNETKKNTYALRARCPLLFFFTGASAISTSPSLQSESDPPTNPTDNDGRNVDSPVLRLFLDPAASFSVYVFLDGGPEDEELELAIDLVSSPDSCS